MKFVVTRDSVAMGDDIDAPHEQSFSFPDETPIIEVVAAIASSGYLASIAGGKATWSANSRTRIAVIAQQWTVPRPLLTGRERGFSSLDVRDGAIYLHFNYWAQVDPEIIYERLMPPKAKASD